MTEIEPGVYLSALPLKEMGFKKWILSNNIAVLCIIDPFEVETTTLAGTAIEAHEIDHRVIVSQDFLPLSDENLRSAAQWIQGKRLADTTVLIHCKSGVGRSASGLAAYYVLNEKMTADAAREKMAEKRPVIYKEGSSHDKAVKALSVTSLE